MLNFDIEPAVLQPFVPRGTELDTWQGRTLMSLVGFRFLKTRIWGLPIPRHRNFEELNLRFYVRRQAPDGWRRGVVFIKELVLRRAIAWVARTLYNENYQAVPMRHRIESGKGSGAAEILRVEYGWTFRGRENLLSVEVDGRGRGAACVAGFARGVVVEGGSELTQAREPIPIEPRSELEFITEHYWGYTRQRDGGTLEYYVEHPPWRVWPTREQKLVCDAAELYGEEFAAPIGAGRLRLCWPTDRRSAFTKGSGFKTVSAL